jgi:hypothetical protein
MLTGKGRRRLGAAAIALASCLAACGSTTTPPSSAASTPPPATAAGSTASASATTPAATTPAPLPINSLDPFLFPEQDTKLATATTQLQQIWTKYKTVIIPSRHTLENMPAVPQVSNITGGALDDATAQSFLNAEFRDNTFIAWAEKNVQPDFMNSLQDPIYNDTPTMSLLRAGKAINDPPCDLYPVNVAVVALDDKTKAFFAAQGRILKSPYALVQTANGPCDVTLASPPPGATPVGSIDNAGETDLIAGYLQHDPVLGDLWFTDASFNCADPKATAKELCLAARA